MKDCSVEGEEVCSVEHESECWTRNIRKEVRVLPIFKLIHQQRQPSHTREQYFNEDLYKTMYSAMYTI